MERAIGKRPHELDTPAAPQSLRYLLELYAEMATARQAGMNWPLPLSWADMSAWCFLTQTPLSAWEVRLLRALDLIWLSIWQQVQPKKTQEAASGRTAPTAPQSRRPRR